jgi:hypothetical protein
MQTTTWTRNGDLDGSECPIDGDSFSFIYGQRAVYTTYDGERMVGTVEAANEVSSGYPIIRFEDGRWGRCDETVELVVE